MSGEEQMEGLKPSDICIQVHSKLSVLREGTQASSAQPSALVGPYYRGSSESASQACVLPGRVPEALSR